MPSKDAAGSAPSIVMLMVDQLSAKWLEVALEEGIVELPGFARLAAQGWTYTRCYTTNPVCSPSRASLLTGLTSTAHGVTECGYRLDPTIPTIARSLRQQGWVTGVFGKLHVSPIIEDPEPDCAVWGFGVAHLSEDGRVGEWLEWIRLEHPEHYRGALSTVWMTMIEGLDTAGPGGSDLRADILAAQAERVYDVTDGHQQDDGAYVLPFPAELSQTEWITRHGLDFIRNVPEDKPFFAHLSYVQPHNPFSPPGDYLDAVDRAKIPAPVPAEWAAPERPAYFDQARYAQPSYETTDWERDRWFYFADLAHLDAQVSRLLDCLEETGRAENTYVLMTADHGELLHDHGLTGKWERHYDACVRVPLILWGPNLTETVRADVVDHLSIVPTIHAITGVPVPVLPRPDVGRAAPAPIPMLPGTPLAPWGSPDDAPPHRRGAILISSNNSHMDASPGSWIRTICTDRYRYSRYFNHGGEQLFDLEHDPDEQHNLVGPDGAVPEHLSAVVADLRDRLLESVVLDGYPNSPRDLYGIGTW